MHLQKRVVFTKHFSGPGRAVGLDSVGTLCTTLMAETNTFDLDVCCAGSSCHCLGHI